MTQLRKTRRIRLLVFFGLALACSTAMIGYAMRDGIQFFRTPSQVLAEEPGAAEVFRLGGMVETESLVRDGAAIQFRLTDGTKTIAVRYNGLLPDLFVEDSGAIATGRMVDGEFRATEILAKHDEEYMPRELMDMARN